MSLQSLISKVLYSEGESGYLKVIEWLDDDLSPVSRALQTPEERFKMREIVESVVGYSRARTDPLGFGEEESGLRMRAGTDFELVNPESDPRYRDFWQTYHQLTARSGVTEAETGRAA